MLGKYKIQAYRFDKSSIALYFPSGLSTANVIIPKFDRENIKHELFIDGEYEQVYLVKENQLDKIHNIIKFQIKGKNEQLKEYKQKLKEEKLKAKNSLKKGM